MKLRYFDYAAATPMDATVLKSMQPFFVDDFYNPSATYLNAQKSKKALEEARKRIALQLGVNSQTITFTAGVTEANNIFIQGVATKFPQSHMLISAVEHESVRGVVEVLQERGHIEFEEVQVDENGQLDLDDLRRKVKENTTLVSVIHVHNEFGTIQDLPAISRIIEQEKISRSSNNNSTPLYLHSDAAQTGNYLSVAADSLGVDAMSLSAAKLYGPKQVGVLYVKKGIIIEPFLLGGEQEHGLRAGTQNVAGTVAMATSLELAQEQRKQEVERLRLLDQRLRKGLESIKKAHLHVRNTKQRVPSLTSVHFEDVDAERLVMELDEKGIMLGRGSACNADSGEPSSSLLALGLNDREARSTIRIAMGRQTTEEDVHYLLEVLKELV